MKHLKLLALPGVLVIVLASLLLGTGFAGASSASSCGQWRIVKSPNVGSTPTLNAVAAVSANDVWAVGSTSGAQPLTEHWNGSSWQVVASPKIRSGGVLRGLAAVSANDVWAVGINFAGQNGQGLTEHWNGTKWSVVPSPIVQAGNALLGVTAISTNNVWAVGYYFNTSDGSTALTLVEHWNGTKWNQVPSPTPTQPQINVLVSISAINGNDMWAVGSSQDSLSNTDTTLAEHWNGSAWGIVNTPNVGSYAQLNAVAAVSTNAVWAVGNDGTTQIGAMIQYWNGSIWSVFKNPGSQMSNTALNGITVLSAHNIWAVGYTTNSSNVTQTFIEHWNGAKWSIVSSPNVPATNNSLDAVSGLAGTSSLWAVGSTGTYNSSKTLVESYC